ncbi:amidohydrolase family protein [Streptococcus agalactiae]
MEPGALADLTVFAADPLQLPAKELAEVQIVATYLDGVQVHHG